MVSPSAVDCGLATLISIAMLVGEVMPMAPRDVSKLGDPSEIHFQSKLHNPGIN
jgi:hypothetical protein